MRNTADGETGFINSFEGCDDENLLDFADHLLQRLDSKQTESLATALKMQGKHRMPTIRHVTKGLIDRLMRETRERPPMFRHDDTSDRTMDDRLTHHQNIMRNIAPEAFERLAETRQKPAEEVRREISTRLWHGENDA